MVLQRLLFASLGFAFALEVTRLAPPHFSFETGFEVCSCLFPLLDLL